MSKYRVAIIGSGPSGIAILNKLAVSLNPNVEAEIYMYDTKMVISPGGPYAIENDHAILNRSVAGMSNYLNESKNFKEWCDGNNLLKQQDHLFLPRKVFGNYLFDQLSEATITLNSKGISYFSCLNTVTKVVIDSMVPKKVKLTFQDHSSERFDHVICSTGNFRNKNPYELREKEGYIDNPLVVGKLEFLKPQKLIAIIGSGLSACETAIILSKNCPSSKIIMVSKSGELPPVRGKVLNQYPKHLTFENVDMLIKKQGGVKTEDMTRLLNQDLAQFNTSIEEIQSTYLTFKEYFEKASRDEIDWYNIIGATNNIVNYFFENLINESEREKFRTVFNKEWIRKRIAIPMETAKELMMLKQEGRLVVIQGTIKELENAYQVNSNTGEKWDVSVVINASGFSEKIDQNTPSYLQHCVREGLLRVDENGKGIVDFESCFAVPHSGKPIETIQLTGAATQGTFFFTSAVDVIDEQASKVAKHLSNRINNLQIREIKR